MLNFLAISRQLVGFYRNRYKSTRNDIPIYNIFYAVRFRLTSAAARTQSTVNMTQRDKK